MKKKSSKRTDDEQLLKRWERAYRKNPFSPEEEDAAWNDLCRVRRKRYHDKLEELSKRGVRKNK